MALLDGFTEFSSGVRYSNEFVFPVPGYVAAISSSRKSRIEFPGIFVIENLKGKMLFREDDQQFHSHHYRGYCTVECRGGAR